MLPNTEKEFREQYITPLYDDNTSSVYTLKEVTDSAILIHLIKMPENIRGGRYWQVISVEAFYNYMLDYCHSGGRIHKGRYMPFTRNFCPRTVNEYLKLFNVELNMMTHESVWDFYEHIGYDYKKKNWKDFISADVRNNW